MNRHRIHGCKRFGGFINRLFPILVRRVILSIGVTLLAGGIAVGDAAAQAWPAKPIHIIVSYAPGVTSDVPAHLMADRLGPRLGQPVIVD